MKHNWNFFQNESADAEKKALLPVLVIPLVVIVLMIVIVLADYGKKRTEESAAVTETAETQEQEPETMAETGESAETETDTAAEAETEASEENGDPYTTENLTHDSVPEVLSLMKKYFTARASGDADTMNEIYGVSGLSFTELEHEKTRLRSNSKYVQEFENITTYVRDGVTADSWLVYALADIKFHSVKTAAPMIMWCYVEKDSLLEPFHFFSMTSPSVSTRSAGSRVSTRTRLRKPPRPIRCPRSPMAAVVEIRYTIYPARVMMPPDVKMEEQDRVTASMQASFFGSVARFAI